MAWNFDCCGAPLAQVLQAPQGLNPALSEPLANWQMKIYAK